jgi:Calx-beta domain
VLSPDVVPGSAGGAGTIGQTGPVGGNAGERAIADFHVGHESGALVLFPTRSGAGGGGGAGFFSGGGGGGGGVYLPVGYGNAGAGENIGITSGGGGGAGSNCMGLFAVQTCAGGATSIQSVNRVLEPNFRSDSGNGEVSIWYPDASISSPAPNTSVLQNTPVNASFTCSVGKADPQIETCSATVTKPDASTQGVASGQALPTGAVGSYTLTVTAVDDLGGTRRLERIYTVTAPQAPVNQALPTITGEPVVGQTLTASDGSWAGTGPINITHQWIRCQRFLDTADRLSCTDIPGATGSTYVVTADDRGFEEEVWVLRVRAQAQNAAGSTWSYSTVTKRVKKHPALPVGPSVVIEGALKEGETLRRNFSGPPLILSQDFDFITQWYRCLVPFGCEQITGANSRRYTLTSADIGFRIRVSLQLKSYSIGSPVAESAISTAVTVAPPSVSIDDRLEYELDADNLLYEFTVTRTGTPAGLAGAATVHYETADGSATTADNDYEQASGEVTFAPGETSKKIQVAVNGDTRFEQNENFFVNLSGPTGATITDSQAMGRIQGDETQPTISIDDVAKAEGNLGSSAYEFTVSLSSPSYQTIGVSRQSASGSASPGDSDFAELAAAPITFSPGETTKQVTVNVGGDTRLEPDEDFFVNLSDASNATIADSQGKGTIRNDDAVFPDLTAPNLAPDLTAPSLAFGASSVQSLRTALRRGIRCSLTTNEAGHLVVRAYVDRRTARRLKIKPNARRDVVVGTLERDLAHGKAVVRVKLSRKARSRMKAATRVKVRILAQITDLAGNVRSRTIRITLRRKLSN